MDTQIQAGVKILKQGGIIIYPTDTAFGIGCRIDDEKAIKRLFALRRRPESQATPVLFDSIGMVGEYVTNIPTDVRQKLMNQYWPGALTIVLEAQTDKVPRLVRGGTTTLGVRVPNHDITLDLIKGVGVPLLGPSANFHGEQTPYSFEDLDEELVGLVDYVVPGECPIKQASTVIDCTVNPWKVLRQGAVSLDL